MALLVQAPVRKPRSGGIKDIVGSFVNEPRLSVAQGAVVWDALGCGLPKATRAGCYDDVVAPAPKTPDSVDVPEAISPPFARFAGVECYLGSDTGGEGSYATQAQSLLEQGEDRSIEAVLWNWAAAAPAPLTEPTLVEALARAEEYADLAYVGQPVILISRYAADQLFAEGALVRENGKLVTAHGNPVLATGAAVADEETTVLTVGQPAVYASPIVTGEAPHWTTNVEMAIAERVYSVGVDCEFRHAVTVTPA